MTAMMVLQPRDWNDLVSIIVMGLVAIAALVLPSQVMGKTTKDKENDHGGDNRGRTQLGGATAQHRVETLDWLQCIRQSDEGRMT